MTLNNNDFCHTHDFYENADGCLASLRKKIVYPFPPPTPHLKKFINFKIWTLFEHKILKKSIKSRSCDILTQLYLVTIVDGKQISSGCHQDSGTGTTTQQRSRFWAILALEPQF